MPLQHLEVWLWGVDSGTAENTRHTRPPSEGGDTDVRSSAGCNESSTSVRSQHKENSSVHAAWSALLCPAEENADSSVQRGAAGSALFVVLGVAAQVCIYCGYSTCVPTARIQAVEPAMLR